MSLSYLPYWFLFGDFSQLFSSLLLHLLFTVWLTTSGGLASRVQRQGDGNRTGRRAATCCCLTIVPKEWSCLVDRGWSAQAAVYCIDGATTSHCLLPTFYPPPPLSTADRQSYARGGKRDIDLQIGAKSWPRLEIENIKAFFGHLSSWIFLVDMLIFCWELTKELFLCWIKPGKP